MTMIPAPDCPFGELKDWLTSEGCPKIRAMVGTRRDGNARMSGNAVMSGNGELISPQDIMAIGSVGSEHQTLTLHRDKVIGVRLNRGCFTGSLDEFMERLTDSDAHQFYRQTVPLFHAELLRRMTPLE